MYYILFCMTKDSCWMCVCKNRPYNRKGCDVVERILNYFSREKKNLGLFNIFHDQKLEEDEIFFLYFISAVYTIRPYYIYRNVFFYVYNILVPHVFASLSLCLFLFLFFLSSSVYIEKEEMRKEQGSSTFSCAAKLSISREMSSSRGQHRVTRIVSRR